MFQIFKKNKRIGTNPSPKSKRPGLPLSHNDGVTICQEPLYPKPPIPGKKSMLTSGSYKVVNVKYDDYNALNQVDFDKTYLLKDMETGTTEWVDENRLNAMKELRLITR